MTWFDWVLIVCWTLTVLNAMINLGRTREPIGRDYLLGSFVINLLLVLGLLWSRGVF